MYTSICWYLRILPVLHRPEVVDIGVKYDREKHAISLKDYRIRSILIIRHAHGDLCKHLGIDSSTDHPDPDRYSNLFLNAYINRHAHTIGITHVFSCINICRVPRMLFEHEADRPSVQHHPRDPASVNAMKQTCVIVILAYFSLFQLNSHRKRC